MMKCQEYIHRLTSGQLEQAGAIERFWAAQHRMICKRCSAFTRNDQRLSEIVQGYREHLARPGEAPPDGPG
jgi:hypothetical protein